MTNIITAIAFSILSTNWVSVADREVGIIIEDTYIQGIAPGGTNKFRLHLNKQILGQENIRIPVTVWNITTNIYNPWVLKGAGIYYTNLIVDQ